MSISLNSVSSILGLLNSSNISVQEKALKRLNSCVESHWSEIADQITQLEDIIENNKNPGNIKELAAFIASKVYYHLTEYEEALKFALQSNTYFNLKAKTQYVQTLVHKCIDKYIEIRKENYEKENPEEHKKTPERYEEIVNTIFEQVLLEQQYKQALGMAFETRRRDYLQEILKREAVESKSGDFNAMVFERASSAITNRKFLDEVLRVTAAHYSMKASFFQPIDYLNLAQIFFNLQDHEGLSQMLYDLITGPLAEENALIAYQIALDISANENHGFVEKIISSFPIENDEERTKKREKLKKILSNELRDELNSTFLTQFSQVDPLMLMKMKDGSDNKKCIQLIGILLAQGVLNAFTGDDKFLKDQQEWLNSSTLWNKFIAIASVGLVHRGTKKDPYVFLNEFLPKPENPRSIGKEYENGGALFGLGLFFFGDKHEKLIQDCISFIRDHAYNQTEEIVLGATLAMGMTALASQDKNIKEALLDVLNMNNATTGEAAALSIGLVMAGSGDALTLEELHRFAKQTNHEKIIRSISLAMAITNFGKSNHADLVVDTLLKENEYMLRYGACMTIGMAYVGTCNNTAIRKLLKISAEDVSDDVRRAAVISLAFVMFTESEQIPQIIRLLNSSYNPHVRYGAALALGIGCAGTCNSEAISMLEGLLKDSVDFVRQGAFIGFSMVVQGYNSKFEPAVDGLRKKMEESSFFKKPGSFMEEVLKLAKDISPSVLSPIGTKVGLAILEAGGRNIGISLASPSGFPQLGACVSMMMFSHYWFWYPLVLFLPFSMSPTALIGVDDDFWIPTNFKFQCNAKQSQFDYPSNIKSEESKKEKTDGPVKLSTTNKVSRRRKRGGAGQAGGEGNEGSFVEGTSTSQINTKSVIHTSIVVNSEEKKAEKAVAPVVPEEPTTYVLSNPSRVVEQQIQNISFIENRYIPVVPERKSGIIFLKDTEQGKYDEYLNGSKGEKMIIEEAPPEDFVFDEEKQKLVQN